MIIPHLYAVSSVYPDRPIRPLPKRRIRSRLSAEAANSILHSSPSAPTERLFQLPYIDPSTYSPSQRTSLEGQASDSVDDSQNESYQFKGNDAGSEDENNGTAGRPYKDQHQRPLSLGTATSRNGYVISRNDTSRYIKQPVSQSVASSGDSVDGYDSFENTNNKKKRKIPTSGSHHSSLSAEMASMGISSTRDIDVSQADQDGGLGHYYGTGSSAMPAKSVSGISGSGRGRHGRGATRRRSARSPLGISFNGPNYARREYLAPGDSNGKDLPTNSTDRGIISAAIANATTFPNLPATGQENVSLHQQSSKKPSSGRTQFTFTCESDAAKSVVWPGYHYASPKGAYPGALPNGGDGAYEDNVATQGTQTSPGMLNQGTQGTSQAPSGSAQAPQQSRKPRRPLSKQYAMAARDRRLRQNYNNFHHPPKEEDVWICEYCEYESIFGRPPEALIRQYEIKDRRERRRLAEKRRLLEKAKMKGRKGKKGNKNNKNANAVTQVQQPNQKQRYDQQPTDELPMDQQGMQSDDYVLDDYDEDPVTTPSLPPQAPSRIPQPVTQNPTHSLRPPSGTGGVRQGSGPGRAI
ncbi:MAG: hypothetical protein Q9217_001392 [Psora testacea]